MLIYLSEDAILISPLWPYYFKVKRKKKLNQIYTLNSKYNNRDNTYTGKFLHQHALVMPRNFL